MNCKKDEEGIKADNPSNKTETLRMGVGVYSMRDPNGICLCVFYSTKDLTTMFIELLCFCFCFCFCYY